MLTEAAKEHLRTCCRLGLRNQFGEKVDVPELEIKDNWESLILHEGTFASVGLKRFYFKDPEINVKDKYHIPFRGFMMPVMDRDVIVVQCISGDFVILRIIGKEDDIEEISRYVRRDTEVHLGMSYEEFKEANRRDLMEIKRIKTFSANFNQSPEEFDKEGNVITSLDHFDNYEYEIVNELSRENISNIYYAEKEKRRLENRIVFLEELKMNYDYCIDEQYIEDAVDAIMSLYPGEIEKYFTKGGEYVYNHIDEISFETELNKGQVWKAWKYMNWIAIEKEIDEINDILDDIEENIDVGQKIKSLESKHDIIPKILDMNTKSKIVKPKFLEQ